MRFRMSRPATVAAVLAVMLSGATADATVVDFTSASNDPVIDMGTLNAGQSGYIFTPPHSQD